jgi:hypothetical protein
MQNHSEVAEFLWKIADLIKDDYDAKNYEDVILPFTLLRRLDCVLQPTRQAVREAADKYKATPEQTRDALLMRAAGQRFYNTSEYSLDELIRRPADLVPNFSAYLAGFSANVKDILYNFSGGEEKGLSPIYETLARKRLILKNSYGINRSKARREPVTSPWKRRAAIKSIFPVTGPSSCRNSTAWSTCCVLSAPSDVRLSLPSSRSGMIGFGPTSHALTPILSMRF